MLLTVSLHGFHLVFNIYSKTFPNIIIPRMLNYCKTDVYKIVSCHFTCMKQTPPFTSSLKLLPSSHNEKCLFVNRTVYKWHMEVIKIWMFNNIKFNNSCSFLLCYDFKWQNNVSNFYFTFIYGFKTAKHRKSEIDIRIFRELTKHMHMKEKAEMNQRIIWEIKSSERKKKKLEDM